MRANCQPFKTAIAVCAIPLITTLLSTNTAQASSARYRSLQEKLSNGRTYALQIERTATRVPRPLLVLLPGLGETAGQLDADSGGYRFGRTHRITVAYGQQAKDRAGYLSWNAGGCCEFAAADDVGYLRQLVADVERRTAVDRHRVYVIGMSNGGMMALRAVCEAAYVFAAAGSVAGPRLQSNCGRPIWRDLHGSADTIVPLHGGKTAWNPLPFPDTTTEADRFGGFVSVGIVAGAQHTWPRVGDGTWNFDGLTDIWTHIALFHL
jgi:poly(3-hydroxybutyrate) depolymerase